MKPAGPRSRLSERLRAVRRRRKGVEFAANLESHGSLLLTKKPDPADDPAARSTDPKE